MSCEWEIYFVPVHASASTVRVSAFFTVSVSVCVSDMYVRVMCISVVLCMCLYKCVLCQYVSVCVSNPMLVTLSVRE